MIDNLKIEKLRNPEISSLGADLEKIFIPYDLVALGLKAETDLFLAFWAEFRSFYGLEKGSLITKTVEELDDRRDFALRGIYGVAESYGLHYESPYRDASDKVLAMFNKYGKAPQNQNYQTETETIRSLADDFEKDPQAKNALTVLGLTNWFAELKTANEDFNNAFIARNKADSAKPDGSQSSRRKQAFVVYRSLMDFIRSAQRFAPMPERLQLISEINTLIAKYNALVDNRNNGGDDDKPEGGK